MSTDSRSPDAVAAEPDRTLVVGVGGGGCSMVARMAPQWPNGPHWALLDTDGRSLAPVPALDTLQIGARVIRGLGTGGDPRVGRRAAESDAEPLRQLLRNHALVIVVAGLGGGTGTGAAPFVAELARQAGALTLGFATLPFAFEGDGRMCHAQRGLASLRTAADAVVCLPNQRLFEVIEDRANIAQAFRTAGETLSRGLQSFWQATARRGIISVDIDHVRALVKQGGGYAVFASLEGRGPDKVRQVLDGIARCPLLERGAVLQAAEAFLVSIMGGDDLTLRETDALMTGIAKRSRPAALQMAGISLDAAGRDRLQVTFLLAEPRERPPGAEPGAGPANAAPALPARPAPAPAAGERAPVQTELFGGRSQFKDMEPTVVNGANLDQPTFLRRNIPIRKGLPPPG